MVLMPYEPETLSRPKSLFRFFCKMVQKNPNMTKPISCLSINARGALACGHKETSMLVFKSKKNGDSTNVNQYRNEKIN